MLYPMLIYQGCNIPQAQRHACCLQTVQHSLTLSKPVSVEHVPGSSLIKLMAQFRFAFRFSY